MSTPEDEAVYEMDLNPIQVYLMEIKDNLGPFLPIYEKLGKRICKEHENVYEAFLHFKEELKKDKLDSLVGKENFKEIESSLEVRLQNFRPQTAAVHA
jgi:hypothetical protein